MKALEPEYSDEEIAELLQFDPEMLVAWQFFVSHTAWERAQIYAERIYHEPTDQQIANTFRLLEILGSLGMDLDLESPWWQIYVVQAMDKVVCQPLENQDTPTFEEVLAQALAITSQKGEQQ